MYNNNNNDTRVPISRHRGTYTALSLWICTPLSAGRDLLVGVLMCVTWASLVLLKEKPLPYFMSLLQPLGVLPGR